MSSSELGDTALVPRSTKNLRCCMNCYLVKTFDQFFQNGCENCEHLNLKGNQAKIEDYTSTNFEGTIALMDPSNSWVARWQG